jgi:hypothetical protein
MRAAVRAAARGVAWGSGVGAADVGSQGRQDGVPQDSGAGLGNSAREADTGMSTTGMRIAS